MRHQNSSRRTVRRGGFTLIELLVVITIIAILAGLIVSIVASAGPKAKIAVARTELAEMESAIKEYRDTLGSYPPDNPSNPAVNPLYFELLGTTNNGITYVTLDSSGKISNGGGDINATFGRQGFANSSTKAHSSHQSGAPTSFLNRLSSKQIGTPDTNKPLIKILTCSVEWPAGQPGAPVANTTLNPWHYVSSHPTNNPGSYDLWVDLVLNGKVRRISNWEK